MVDWRPPNLINLAYRQPTMWRLEPFFCKDPGSNPPEGAGPGTPQTAAIILLFLAREVQLFSSFRKVGGWGCLANITFLWGFRARAGPPSLSNAVWGWFGTAVPGYLSPTYV